MQAMVMQESFRAKVCVPKAIIVLGNWLTRVLACSHLEVHDGASRRGRSAALLLQLDSWHVTAVICSYPGHGSCWQMPIRRMTTEPWRASVVDNSLLPSNRRLVGLPAPDPLQAHRPMSP